MLSVRYVCVCFALIFVCVQTSQATYFLEEDTAPNRAQGVHFCGEALPFQDPRVVKQFLEIVQASKGRMTRIGKQAAEHFKVIEPILRQHHIPNDFKYLSIVESALQAHATSVKGAHGYWQFMPETARAMGLKVTPKIDERRHLVKSTQAACRYFNHLFEQLGSWTLVAAAYNTGPGRLDSYMNKAQSMSYFDLNLNRETGEYLYRVVAAKELLTRPQRYEHKISPAKKVPSKTSAVSSNDTSALFLPTPQPDDLFFKAGIEAMTTLVEKPKNKPMLNTLITRLREAAAAQKGQIWIFEITESVVIENTLLQAGDYLYAEVEDVERDQNRIYLRASRIYSAQRHSFYILPFAAINAQTGQLGIGLNDLTNTAVVWKRL